MVVLYTLILIVVVYLVVHYSRRGKFSSKSAGGAVSGAGGGASNRTSYAADIVSGVFEQNRPDSLFVDGRVTMTPNAQGLYIPSDLADGTARLNYSGGRAVLVDTHGHKCDVRVIKPSMGKKPSNTQIDARSKDIPAQEVVQDALAVLETWEVSLPEQQDATKEMPTQRV